MTFKTTGQQVLEKAKRVDEIAEEMQTLFRDLGKLQDELWQAMCRENLGPGVHPQATWVNLVDAAKRETQEAVHGGISWERLDSLTVILRRAWGHLIDTNARSAVEGAAPRPDMEDI